MVLLKWWEASETSAAALYASAHSWCTVYVFRFCLFLSDMASKYFRLSSLGRSSDLRDEDDEIEAAAAICMLQQKLRRGGSVPGHRVYNRDRAGADKQLMADYFVERPLYNEDHFRRRYFVMFTSCPTVY